MLEYGGFDGKKGGIVFQKQDMIKYVPLDGWIPLTGLEVNLQLFEWHSLYADLIGLFMQI